MIFLKFFFLIRPTDLLSRNVFSAKRKKRGGGGGVNMGKKKSEILRSVEQIEGQPLINCLSPF